MASYGFPFEASEGPDDVEVEACTAEIAEVEVQISQALISNLEVSVSMEDNHGLSCALLIHRQPMCCHISESKTRYFRWLQITGRADPLARPA